VTVDAKTTVRSELNVTPLVDVCLVLLIIFMVVAPILHTGVKVDLPKTSNTATMQGDQNQLRVSIAEDGSVYIRDSRVSDADLPSFLAAIRGAEADREVIVRGDRRLGYERVSEVLALLSEAGFQRVALVTEKRSGAPIR
jgi:biopolymer transport protein TolR